VVEFAAVVLLTEHILFVGSHAVVVGKESDGFGNREGSVFADAVVVVGMEEGGEAVVGIINGSLPETCSPTLFHDGVGRG